MQSEATHRVNRPSARAIADGLTWFRVFSVIPITLLVLADLRWWVFGIYIAASLSDFLDGLFARRAQPTRYGSSFDSYADVFFAVMTFIWIAILFPGFLDRYGWSLVLPWALLQTALFALRFRAPNAVVPHLVLGRIAFFVFCLLLPVLLVLGDLPWFVVATLGLSIVAKIQLAWHLTTLRPQQSTPGIT